MGRRSSRFYLPSGIVRKITSSKVGTEDARSFVVTVGSIELPKEEFDQLGQMHATLGQIHRWKQIRIDARLGRIVVVRHVAVQYVRQTNELMESDVEQKVELVRVVSSCGRGRRFQVELDAADQFADQTCSIVVRKGEDVFQVWKEETASIDENASTQIGDARTEKILVELRQSSCNGETTIRTIANRRAYCRDTVR